MNIVEEMMEAFSAQQHWSLNSKLTICLDYINAQQQKEDIHQMNVRSCDTFNDYLQERVDDENDNDIRQYYANEECPDCGEDIPVGSQAGENCTNCGHVFWKPKKDD